MTAKSLVYLDQDNPGKAKAALLTLQDKYPDHEKKMLVTESLDLLDKYEKTPKKSRVLAGTMSAILPGSGYFYAERYGDGVSAFIINALFIGAAYESFSEDNDTAGVIATAFGLPFYIGNIYGSANAAKKWNIEIRKGTRDAIFTNLKFVF